ncbi:MAG: CRTAC1 family protein [Acidobacteria bacterium]|nr:CRTAC1 family protein [Acidobacteriota bacterium]
MTPGANPEVRFVDVTKQAGIRFERPSTPEKKYVVESIGAGVALFDFDNDGFLDIYFVNGQSVETAGTRPGHASALFRNNRDGTFTNVAEKAGVAYPGWGMGAAVADVNNDGWLDLYVTCFGPNRLYLNNGNGTFRDVSQKSGEGDSGCAQGAAFGDYDKDGYVDLYVANYIEFDLNTLPEFGKGHFCHFRGIPVQCGPRGLPGGGDVLYHNNGDGTFTNVTAKAKVLEQEKRYGMGVVWSDFDKDGWLDLYVANDTQPNYLYRNLGDGTFEEIGLASGVAVAQDGNPQGSMGVTVGDYNRDGLPDLFVTNYADQYNALYRQDRPFFFSDVSFSSRIASSSFPFVGWGAGFLDFDKDGWQDLLALNGHVYPQIEQPPVNVSYPQRGLLYRNNNDGTFTEVTAQSGEALMKKQTSRGAAFGDIDNDGDVDVVVNNLDGGPALLRNDGGNDNHWLLVKAKGTRSNTAGIGAQVKVTTAEFTQEGQVCSGSSYVSQNDLRLHFGLGKHTQVNEVEVRWPSGGIDRRRNVPANQIMEIVEGEHSTEPRPQRK